uniref:CNNM transmembrane domain-containing protein n=1 Tax=Rhodosorus marinus TaxID=101924 RepID=A0A7S2ZMJ9_9RHOD|mmetsp:Transcript_24443/g.96422  ORF Transcript_24443/g.96422 Transcript_24443/m.96422 type:complete len:402 (+) Transcript_24443:483-1688(+)
MVEWWRIVVAVVCLCLSGLFSGLTLGLFALDLTDLDILLDSGTEKEKTYAKKIYPLRKRGNYLLCTLLIGNTAVNSALAIVTAELFGGISGFLASTFLILYVGEIIPQSVCHKYGLVIGAYASPLVYMFMLLTFPLSWPTAKVLDWFLGGESPVRYDKTQLQSLVTLHGSTAKATLSEDETRILNAALMFAQKNIEQIMTPLSKVFMLEVHEHLDSKNLLLVFQSGHSRIPVYERDRHNILGVLFAKDILLIDPEDNIPVSTVMNFFKRELKYSFNDTRLDKMLNEFETGRGHLAVVQKVISFGQGDPYYETIGIVTLEDVIEELIGSEIVDETDVYESNSSTKKMNRKRYIDSDVLRLFSHDSSTTSLQDNEVLAVSSFLSTHLEEFSSRKIPVSFLPAI